MAGSSHWIRKIGIVSVSVSTVVGVSLLAGCGLSQFWNEMNAQPPTGPQTVIPTPPAASIEAAPVPDQQPASHVVVTQDPTISVAPSVKQGEALKVEVTPHPTDSAFKDRHGKVTIYFAGRTAPMFYQNDGTLLGVVAVKVDKAPQAYPLTLKDDHGAVLFRENRTVASGGYSRQNIRVTKSMGGIQPLPGELETIGKLKKTTTPVRFWTEPFVKPTSDCMNSGFGNLRYHNGKFTGNYHKGIDTRSPGGRPIHAITGGKVQIAKAYRLHGKTVGLDHGQGVTSIYIHMSKMAVKEGDMVKKGQVIGYVGSTGFATGPHLHMGLYMNGIPINPIQWIRGIPRC